ncbi:MAG: hypothetical protein H7099_04095 [Gemmatimonadaceae bacterium]|nr:hypothetical protein [Gemmatimonadaceae bacterium]
MDHGPQPALPSRCSSAEIALIFADQLVLSFPDRFAGNLQSPLTGRTVEQSAIGPVLLEVLIGGLKACATLAVSMQSRRTLFGTEDAAHITLTVSHSTFPFGSPEQQLVAWLAAQPKRNAFVDDAIMKTLIPFDSPNPQGLFFERALSGLVSRKIYECRTRTRWWLFSDTSLHLTEPTASDILPHTRAFLTRLAQQRAQLAPAERLGVRNAFDVATTLRTAQSAS